MLVVTVRKKKINRKDSFGYSLKFAGQKGYRDIPASLWQHVNTPTSMQVYQHACTNPHHEVLPQLNA